MERRARLDLRDHRADDDPAVDAEEPADTHLSHAFHRSLVVGEERLRRSWPNLIATGFLGGMDVGVGVLALMVVRAATGNELLGALAFSSGFITLTLARSELFTENFLVPVTVVVTERRHGWTLVRLWIGTLLSNWAGGALFIGLVTVALPHLHDTGIEIGRFYPDLGITWRAFASAMLGGILITLMTWIERASRDTTARLAVAVITAFLLAAPPLNHSIVGALEMFAGLFAGDSAYSWADAGGAAGWAVLGNMVGGLGLVTVFRLVQVGAVTIDEERHTSADSADSGRSHSGNPDER
jgi:formate/nitrite transporter FocA (FNT family)